jgi:tol-pal system protein YbgF
MAVIFAALVASGCATKRDVEEIKDRLNRVEENSRQSQQMMSRMDSVIAAGAESNRMLQNDIRYSTDELTRQMSQLLENYNDLLTKIDQLSERQVIKLPPKSSPGAQADVPGDTSSGPPPSRQPAVDCIDTYDNAFTLVRRGEYKQAREGFRNFIVDCETHSDVENAYYWIGECYYSEEEYTQAITEYEHLVNTYPDSPNIGRALYKLARCKQELGKKNEARELFERLVRDHAGTLEAEQAAQRLKDL